MAKMSFASLCMPAKVYLVLSAISLVIGLVSQFHIIAILTKLFFILLWTWVLNWLCSKGLKTLSWILVLLPIILFLVAGFALAGIFMKAKKDQKHQ